MPVMTGSLAHETTDEIPRNIDVDLPILWSLVLHALTFNSAGQKGERTMADISLSRYNRASDAAVKHLRNAATWEPKVRADGFTRSGMKQVVTSDSLDRYLKANHITGDEKSAVLQAFTTLAGRQSRGAGIAVVDVSKLRTLSSTLKGFAKTHNAAPKATLSNAEQAKMGKTGKSIIKGSDELLARRFSGMETEKSFSKKVDTVLEHLLVKANTGSPYMHWYELVNYSRKPSISPELQDALWKSFRYIGRTMTYGETNSTQICIDQRQEAHRILMKLFAGNSDTKRAIANF